MALKKSVDIAKRDWILSKLQDPSIPWNWDELSRNDNITWDIVQAKPDEQWCWYGLSQNANIKYQHQNVVKLPMCAPAA